MEPLDAVEADRAEDVVIRQNRRGPGEPSLVFATHKPNGVPVYAEIEIGYEPLTGVNTIDLRIRRPAQ